MAPDEVTGRSENQVCVVVEVHVSPVGMKWSFWLNQRVYLAIICNADESEPGTFKDHHLMMKSPHT